VKANRPFAGGHDQGDSRIGFPFPHPSENHHLLKPELFDPVLDLGSAGFLDQFLQFAGQGCSSAYTARRWQTPDAWTGIW